MISPIFHSESPISILGGAEISREDLNNSRKATDAIVAADGGARHAIKHDLVPDVVIGDLDSLSAEAREACAGRIHHITDQDTTDFEKVILRVDAPLMIGLGFLGGRLDHTVATLNVLVRHVTRPIVLRSEPDVVFAIPAGRTELPLPAGCPFALLPMAPARATTQGLVWDMADQPTAMDGLVSSSNAVKDGPVQIDLTAPAIVSLGLVGWDAALSAVRGR